MKVCEGLQELICAYADRELDETEVLEVEKHLKACGCCQKFLELQHGTKKLVRRSMDKIEVPQDLRKKVIEILNSECEEFKKQNKL